jgi:TorA maturation chaperone TorD
MTEPDPQTAARADFCRFLCACYYEPGPEFAQERLFESLRAAAAQFDPALAEGAARLGEAFGAARDQDLLVEYTRLFIGPIDAPAPPYGSLWLGPQKRLMDETTVAVQRLYEEGGFELTEDFHEPPDHVAAELEFLYALLFHESRAGSPERLALKKRFLDEHLGRWTGPFTDALRSASREPFYRQLADLTASFVSREAARSATS